MMSIIKKHLIHSLVFLLISCSLPVFAQQDISWLGEHTGEMEIGNELFRYSFTTVGGNDCKVEFKEYVTDRKGETESRSWVFYLSDIDPDALHFNARGRSIQVILETRNSQRFISYYEEGELDEYTDEIALTMNEVDMTRQFIDALKEHIGACTATEASWQDREAVMDWLIGSIGQAVDGDTQWEQQFSRGEKPHLVKLSSRSLDGKGEEGQVDYLFDLSDIDTLSIKMEVSGRSLQVALPVSDRMRYIETVSGDEKEFSQELKIYADDIEVARQIVHALGYLISRTEAERPAWEDYNGALEYVQGHLGEVRAGDILYQNSLEYDLFASDILDLSIRETESGEETEETIYSFYPSDMTGAPNLVVSRNAVTVEMKTSEDRDFIRETSGGSVSGYGSEVQFHAESIDEARNLISAWDYLIQNSQEELEDFESVEEVNTWLEGNFPSLYRDNETYEQALSVSKEWNNRILFDKTVTEDGGEKTETTYVLYPEDIIMEDLDIRVRLGKLAVSLETGRVNYIKQIENGTIRPFTNRADVYFFDPLVAKNFIEAIRFLRDNISGSEIPEMNREEAFEFLSGNIPTIERKEESFEQLMEMMDGDICKLKFTRVETGKDGEEEYNYEFTAADLSNAESTLSVRGDLIEIHLETTDSQDLVKPYENGEVQDFTDGFIVYSDDVLQARRILRAFGILSDGCR